MVVLLNTIIKYFWQLDELVKCVSNRVVIKHVYYNNVAEFALLPRFFQVIFGYIHKLFGNNGLTTSSDFVQQFRWQL
jgi:hypothetical protein